MNIKKLNGDRVLIEVSSDEKKTAKGIVLSQVKNPGDFTEGVIAYVGTGKVVEGVGQVEVGLAVGQKVIFHYGMKIEVDGKPYILANSDDVVLTFE